MIETGTKPTVDAVVEAAMHRTLRVLARVSLRQGWTYDGPALLIARELFPDKVNVRTWAETYGGGDWSRRSWYDLAYYSGRSYTELVSANTLRDEYHGAVVSRETSVIEVPVPENPLRTCQCNDCSDEACGGDDECEPCENHGCAQCHGEDYRCDDHDCESCFGDHSVDSCCGWCSECQTHPDGTPDHGDSDTCSNCGYCHECGHVCEDA